MTHIIRPNWKLDLYDILIDKERYVNTDKHHKDKFKENIICIYTIEQNHENQVKRKKKNHKNNVEKKNEKERLRVRLRY